MGRLVIFPHPLLETAAELIQGTELRQVERSVPVVFQRKEPAFDFLSEYSDKKLKGCSAKAACAVSQAVTRANS